MVFLKNTNKVKQKIKQNKSTLSVYHQKHIKKLTNKEKKTQAQENQLNELQKDRTLTPSSTEAEDT